MSLFRMRDCVFLAGLALATGTGYSQINSSASSVALTATMNESLTISVGTNAVSFALVPNGGTANGNASIQIVTTWVLAQGRANVTLQGYFASSAAALSYAGSPAVNIPSSAVFGQVTSGSTSTAFTAFTQSPSLSPSGAGLNLFTQALTASTRESNRTDVLALQIQTTAAMQLPAATYTGTMMLQAQAL